MIPAGRPAPAVSQAPTHAALTAAGETWSVIYNLAAPLFGDEKAQAMASAASDHARGPASTAERRAQVLQLLAEGHTQRAIATALGVNRSTIAEDLAALRRETGAGRSWHLVTEGARQRARIARAPLTPAGAAWLRTYDAARSLGFDDDTAQRQAFAAADAEPAQDLEPAA